MSNGFNIEIPVFDCAKDQMTIEVAARFCGELVRQGILFDAKLVTDHNGTPVFHVQPTGGF